MSRTVINTINPQDWDSQNPGSSGYQRTRWLQSTADVVNAPIANRGTATTAGAAVAANGNNQSTGIGTANAQKPKSYAEFTVKARITFTVNSVGPVYLTIFRTLGNVPANGAAPNVGDVAVGGDAFFGAATVNGSNTVASFSYLDTGLDVTKSYKFYLAVKAPAGNTVNILNTSQIIVMERS
jgi:hypothetical protein